MEELLKDLAMRNSPSNSASGVASQCRRRRLDRRALRPTERSSREEQCRSARAALMAVIIMIVTIVGMH